MQDDRHEDEQDDKGAAFAVDQAISALNQAIRLCAERRLSVEVNRRGYSEIGVGSWEHFSASVKRIEVIKP